jgi:hypothetical protein
MSEVGEEPKPLVLGVSALRSTPNRQDAVSALLRKLGNVSKPADVHTFFPLLKGCKVCGVEHPEAETCPASDSKEVCGYCGRAGHLPDVCRALHNVCGICLVRGHRAGTECPDDLRLALQRFEQFADLGQLTRLRHANPFWGFYFFDQRWSMMEMELQYGELILMSPAEALLFANRPFVRSFCNSRRPRGGSNGRRLKCPMAKGEPWIPKGSRRSKIGLISWSEPLNQRVSRPPKTIEPPTAVEARVEAEGPTEELEAGGSLPPPSPPSRTSKSSAPLKRQRAEVLKGAPEGHTGNTRREGKDVAKGNNLFKLRFPS